MIRILVAMLALCWTAVAAQAQTITVVSPNGGETWAQKSVRVIKWTSSGLPANATVNVVLRLNNMALGPIWSAPASAGSIQWPTGQYGTPPTQFATPGPGFRVRVRVEGIAEDDSDTPFTIGPAETASPTAQFLNPAGGASWVIGSPQTIRWTANFTGAIVLTLFWSKPSPYTPPERIHSATVYAEAGQYVWTAGSTVSSTLPVAQPGGHYYLALYPAGSGTAVAKSGTFRLRPAGPHPDLVICLRKNAWAWGGHNLKVRVKNMGAASAGASRASFVMSGTNLNRHIEVPPLNPMGSHTAEISTTWGPLQGDHPVGLSADVSTIVAEMDEMNNSLHTHVQVTPNPPGGTPLGPPLPLPFHCSNGHEEP